MSNKFSLRQFKYNYGTHEKCLEAIKQLRFPDPITCPKCNTIQKFYPVKGRTAYACNSCGNHIYPLAGTIFEKSTTGLDLWFFAMYLMTQTRSGTSAKQLERMLGVTYKTAWRMFKQIRMLMANSSGGSPLDGIVEIDETFVGGKGKNKAYEADFGKKQKAIVMGIVQRRGKAYFKLIGDTSKWTLINQIKENVSPTAHLMTDELASYRSLTELGYLHDSVAHSNNEYVSGIVHNNTVEGFWSILKRGVYGVYRVVSKKYLQSYVDEYAWRYNNREGQMFDLLLNEVPRVRLLKAGTLS